MKFKISQELEIRSVPAYSSGKSLGILQPGYIIDIIEETKGDNDIYWLKDGNGFYYEKRLVKSPVVKVNSGQLDLNLKAPWLKENFDISGLWNRSTGKDINVAILDSGIFEHEDLVNNINSHYAKAFVGDSIMDLDGHGTHVAGIIGANGSKKIIGVAPHVNLIPIKVFERADSNVSTTILIKALEYAASIPNIHIINLSLVANNNASNYDKLKSTIEKVVESGVIVVGASGNKWGDFVSAPANIEQVISVSALSRMLTNEEKYQIPLYSNYGNKVDTACIGHHILSCGIEPLTLSKKNGTSMAAAYMSGVMALKLQMLNESDTNYSTSDFSEEIRNATFNYAERKNKPAKTLPVFNPIKFLTN